MEQVSELPNKTGREVTCRNEIPLLQLFLMRSSIRMKKYFILIRMGRFKVGKHLKNRQGKTLNPGVVVFIFFSLPAKSFFE